MFLFSNLYFFLPEAKTCIGCSRDGLKACSRCKACYCSVDCQRSHWPVHQKECGKSRDVQSDKKPMTNGIVNHGARKSSQHVVEDEFLVEMDGFNTDSDVVFSIEDIMPQTQLKKRFKAVIYVIEDMLMKGQAVDASETERFLELMQELSQYFADKHQSVSPSMCKEGILVLFDYLGEVTRGVVTKLDSSKAEVAVLAIDYGNTETVKVSDLFLMPRFALGFPMQCRTLALHGLPVSMDASTKVSLNKHLKSITQEKIFECSVKSEANGVCSVVMAMEDATESVNDMIRSQYERLKELKEVKVPKRIMLQYIPLQPYPTEPEFDVIVTEVRSPSCFFAQILTKDRSNINALSQLFNRLQELKSDTELVDFSPVANEACLAFFIQDQTWSRAAVERINPDGTVRVSFIDYGNVEDVDSCYIRPMTNEFSLLPRQARKFCVSGVQSSSTTGEWSDEACSLFKDMLLNESICHASCVSVDGDKCCIKLYLPSSNSYPHKLLLNKGHAIAADSCKQKDVDETLPFTLQSPNIQATGDYRVIPVHFESPHEFYVQVANAEKIQQVFEFDALIQRLPVVQYDKPVPEDSCCALFSDDVWYRAKVLSVEERECSLYFYDYGNKATLPIKSLRKMPEEMKSLEAQAVRTKLDNIAPIGGTWTDKAKDFMDSSLSFKPCVLNVSKVENGLVIGRLTVEENGVDVATLLIEAHLAKLLSSMKSISSQRGVAESIKEDSSFDLDLSTRPVTQANVARKVFTLRTEKLAAPSTQRVIPVHFESPHEFYVQVANAEKIQQVFEFDALLRSLPVVQYDNPIPEDSCCALFSDDVWYRAKVISVKGTECCVYFYDYGNKATLPIKNLREMPEELKSLEAQAIKTKLDNVAPIEGNWGDEAKEVMDSNMSFKPCVLNVLKVENGLAIGNLTVEESGKDIGMLLMENHLAKPLSSMKSIDSQRGATKSINEGSSFDVGVRAKPVAQVNVTWNAFTLSTEKLSSPGTKRVIPVHFESPHEFYVQVANAEKLQQVFEFDVLLQNLPVVQYSNPVPEDSCCALFSDGVWYRAKVISVKGTECHVYFYDYGNKATLPLASLREMPEELKSLEAQAIRTKLDNVTSTGESWGDEAKELMNGSLTFQPCILNISKIENGFVIGRLTVEESGVDVATMLIEAQLAKHPSSMKGLGSQRRAEGNNENSCIDRRTNPNSEVEIRKKTFMLNTEKLAAPSIQRVIPVHFESPHEFYVQVANAEKIQQVFEFDALLRSLPVVQYDNPIPEDSCCALFSDDVWYRAKVISVKGTECCVYFYDYGNKATLPIKNLREMPEEMKSLEAQAVKTKLENVAPIEGSWTIEAKEFMDSNLSFKPCVLNVSKVENGFVIGKLTVEESGVDISLLLTKANFAKPQSNVKYVDSQIGAEGSKENDSLDGRARPISEARMRRTTFTLRTERLKAPNTQRVIPVHFESPHEFYVQVADAEKIQQVFEFDALLQSTPVVQYDKPVPEDSCCALYSDGIWYRAKVISVKGTECCVYFYDYGNKATLPMKNLREMPEELKSLEAQAVKTKLDNVAPIEGSWTDEAKDLMESSLSFKPCVLNVSKVENGLVCGKLTVEENGVDVATLLIDAHLANSPSNMKSMGIQRVVDGVKENSSLELRTQPIPETKMRSKVFTLHTEKLAAPSTHCVVPVHFESPHEFYVQVANAEKLQQVYEFDVLLQNLPVVQYSNPVPEDSCCALYSDDVWYRAKVISVKGTECCVYFYDYGNKATLPIKNLREMPEELKSLPAQAIRTKLDNLAPIGKSWTNEAKEMMDSCLSFKPCVLNISNVENCTVSGSLLREGDGLDISKQLVVSCLARSDTHSDKGDGACVDGKLTVYASGKSENNAGDEQSEGAFHCEPTSKQVKGNGVADKSSHASDSERSSGDSGSGEHNFYSQKSKKFAYRQNSKDRNRSLAAGRDGPVFRSEDHKVARNGGKLRHNYQIPPFPPYPPLMFPSLFFGSDFPYSAMAGYKGESDEESQTSESHFSRASSWGGRGSSFQWKRGTASGRGYPSSRGRGRTLNDWVDAWNKMSDFMNSSRGRYSYDAFRHQGSFRGWQGARGRGGFHSMSRGPKPSHEKFSGHDIGKIPASLRIGSEIECIVTFVEHPFHFYIKLSKDMDSRVLSGEVYENAAFAQDVEFGVLGAAKNSVTGQFFRAKVERMYSEERVLVRDVDSGVTEIVDLPSGLKQLLPDDASKPFRAIRCTLNNVVPKNSDRWSVSATKYLKHRLVVEGKKVKAHVCGEGSFAVKVSIRDPDSEESPVEEDFVKMGFARFIRLVCYQRSLFYFTGLVKALELFVKCLNVKWLFKGT